MRIILLILLAGIGLTVQSQELEIIPADNDHGYIEVLYVPSHKLDSLIKVVTELEKIINTKNDTTLEAIKVDALSNNALSTILSKYKKDELKECADRLGIEYGNTKTSIAKELIKHYNKQ